MARYKLGDYRMGEPSLDPPDDGPECPECGGRIEQERGSDKWAGSVWCMDEECGWSFDWDRIDEGLAARDER